MPKEAIALLAQIDRGREIDPLLLDRWLSALKTVSWVTGAGAALALTPAGRGALLDAALTDPDLD
jgi:hypothetical protein